MVATTTASVCSVILILNDTLVESATPWLEEPSKSRFCCKCLCTTASELVSTLFIDKHNTMDFGARLHFTLGAICYF